MFTAARFAAEHALRTFPLFAVDVHLCVVTLAIGNDSPDAADLGGFFGYWPVLAIFAAFFVYLPTYVSTRSVGSALRDALNALGYFVAVSLLRAKPVKFLGAAGDTLAYTVGPVLLVACFAVPFAYYFNAARSLDRGRITRALARQVSDDAELTSSTVHSVSAAVKGEASHVASLAAAVLHMTRRHAPVPELMLHLLVVSLAISDGECEHVHLNTFAVYWALLLAACGARRFANALASPIAGRGERYAYACGEAALATLHLFALTLLRAKPIKCYTHVGLALAYGTSVPALVATLLLSIGSTYLYLRNYSHAQLLELNAQDVGLVNKQS